MPSTPKKRLGRFPLGATFSSPVATPATPWRSAGDTAYTDLYGAYAGRGIDLAILPIGAYDPWIANHANPEEAWRMGREMGGEYLMPIHHSTFRLSREPMEEPLQRFLAAAGPEDWRVVSREIGQAWTLPAMKGAD